MEQSLASLEWIEIWKHQVYQRGSKRGLGARYRAVQQVSIYNKTISQQWSDIYIKTQRGPLV